jgi:hypothetical protein
MEHKMLKNTSSIIPSEVQTLLKYVYAQKKFKTPLLLDENMHHLSDMIANSHQIAQSYFIDHVKDNCRTQWYLTLTETNHMSQICGKPFCMFCPTQKRKLIDLSDENKKCLIEGSICFSDRDIVSAKMEQN